MVYWCQLLSVHSRGLSIQSDSKSKYLKFWLHPCDQDTQHHEVSDIAGPAQSSPLDCCYRLLESWPFWKYVCSRVCGCATSLNLHVQQDISGMLAILGIVCVATNLPHLTATWSDSCAVIFLLHPQTHIRRHVLHVEIQRPISWHSSLPWL